MRGQSSSSWVRTAFLVLAVVYMCVYFAMFMRNGAGQRAPCTPSPHKVSAISAATTAALPISSADDAENLLRNREAVVARGYTEHYPQETIFIAVASYGDPECAPTIERIFARAAHPDRIFLGVCQQHDCHGDDVDNSKCKDCVGSLVTMCHKEPKHPVCSRMWQIQITRMPMDETKGVTYARYLSEKMYRGETYAMTIDSHMRFTRGWDSQLVNVWKDIGDDYAVLTNYPTGYPESAMGIHGLSDDYEMPQVTYDQCICKSKRFETLGCITFHHMACAIHTPKTGSVRVAHLAAGFNFAKGHRMKNVPYDPYTPFLFDGEEFSFGARLWTHGYDLYHPEKQVMTHLYLEKKKDTAPGQAARRTFWDEPDLWAKRHPILTKSTKRINWLMGLHEKNNPGTNVEDVDQREADVYGVGSVRTMEQYFKWAGVDFECKLPCFSDDKLSVYEAGGMPSVHRPGIDK
eukprot:TRINITY_DN6301_c0_g1_i2.p1 TRINITY_DN6301_c0_g1~~TRINITY_DN6301_c0_g1_i2.p1  ORF type:complete len:462 (+),score=129.61 TRINITY_DN6301_c0_g1_i2:41-1426(+)